MRKINIFVSMLILGSLMAYGQASRTWVSGVGDDANPCSRTAPCKTFAGAISKTAAGGEIDALDPAGYGAVTITKAITIDGGGGQVASVLVSGTNGIVVQAGPSDVVILRNLRINGIGTGINGIRFLAGKDLNVENDYIFGFTNNCIDIAVGANASVHIVNTLTKNCGQDGVRATTTAGQVQVGIESSQFLLSGANGVEAADHSRIVIDRSFIEHATGSGLNANATAGDCVLTADHSDVSYNGTGASATGGALIILADNKFAFNTTQVSGACNSYGTNRFDGASLGSCPLKSPGQQ
jgi:hypothetical protein